MPTVQSLTHRGQTIVKTSFPPEADLAAMKSIMAETGLVYRGLPPGSVLSLVEFGPREFDPETIDLIEKVARLNARTVKATAFVGVSDEQKPLFKAMISITGRQASVQPTEAAALDWLAEARAADEDPLAGF